VVVVTAMVLAAGGSAPAVAAPSVNLGIVFAPGSPAPPVLNQPYGLALPVGNDGDVNLARMTLTVTLPVEMTGSSVTTGSYTALTDFAAGESVRVSYEKNTAPGVFTLWGSSPKVSTDATLTSHPPVWARAST
jgi:large repetitive protein